MLVHCPLMLNAASYIIAKAFKETEALQKM